MTIELHLLRDIHNAGTLGVLQVAGHKLYTIERPWIPHPDGGRSGARFESCVSIGSYRVVPHRSEKYAQAWALVNPGLDVYYQPRDVPRGREQQARVAILIHAGNFWWDVVGCIAPGKERAKLNGGWMVRESRSAMNELRTLIGRAADVVLFVTSKGGG